MPPTRSMCGPRRTAPGNLRWRASGAAFRGIWPGNGLPRSLRLALFFFFKKKNLCVDLAGLFLPLRAVEESG